MKAPARAQKARPLLKRLSRKGQKKKLGVPVSPGAQPLQKLNEHSSPGLTPLNLLGNASYPLVQSFTFFPNSLSSLIEGRGRFFHLCLQFLLFRCELIMSSLPACIGVASSWLLLHEDMLEKDLGRTIFRCIGLNLQIRSRLAFVIFVFALCLLIVQFGQSTSSSRDTC